MQGETVNVLDTLGSVPDGDFPQMFIEKLVLVMEHSKEEILELLKSKPIAVLKKLRELAFAELVKKMSWLQKTYLFSCTRPIMHCLTKG